MNRSTWQKALSGVLILSVLWLVAVWTEHQLAHLDPEHSEQHCQLCIQLHKLSSSLTSTALLSVPMGLLVLLVISACAYQYQVLLRQHARAPPSILLNL